MTINGSDRVLRSTTRLAVHNAVKENNPIIAEASGSKNAHTEAKIDLVRRELDVARQEFRSTMQSDQNALIGRAILKLFNRAGQRIWNALTGKPNYTILKFAKRDGQMGSLDAYWTCKERIEIKQERTVYVAAIACLGIAILSYRAGFASIQEDVASIGRFLVSRTTTFLKEDIRAAAISRKLSDLTPLNLQEVLRCSIGTNCEE